jgi:hypothetical protein
MTRLLAAATIATALDALMFVLLVAPGYVPEANPIVASLTVPVALWARAAVIVLLVSLTVLAGLRPERHLRLTVAAALVVAIAVGLLGAATTALAVIA